MTEQTPPNAAAETPNQVFNIAKIYLKDISFECPNSPEVFQQEWQPQANVELTTAARPVADHTYEVVVTVTVTTKLGDKTAYLCEVQQAGIFQLEGFDEQTLRGLLGAFCPNILFPYAREAVSDIVTRGGFPQMLLGPVNFDALYAQRVAQEQQQQTSAQQH